MFDSNIDLIVYLFVVKKTVILPRRLVRANTHDPFQH